jgi:nickel-type superoxide dismutase maturation protease
MASGKRIHLFSPRLPQLAMVEGPSMEPCLPDGAWVVLLPRPGRMPRVGQIVVAEHPLRPGFALIKRVASVDRSRGLVWLAGDNREESTDSEDFGPLPVRLVVGAVVAILRPGRPRLLRAEPRRLW